MLLKMSELVIGEAKGPGKSLVTLHHTYRGPPILERDGDAVTEAGMVRPDDDRGPRQTPFSHCGEAVGSYPSGIGIASMGADQSGDPRRSRWEELGIDLGEALVQLGPELVLARGIEHARNCGFTHESFNVSGEFKAFYRVAS
jgi:hypothetical protein